MSKQPVFTIDENGERKCHFLDHQLAAARSKKKIAGISDDKNARLIPQSINKSAQLVCTFGEKGIFCLASRAH